MFLSETTRKALVRRKPYSGVLWGTTSEDAIVDQSASRPWKVHAKPSSQSAKLIPNGRDACRNNHGSSTCVDGGGETQFVTQVVDVGFGWRLIDEFLDDRSEISHGSYGCQLERVWRAVNATRRPQQQSRLDDVDRNLVSEPLTCQGAVIGTDP